MKWKPEQLAFILYNNRSIEGVVKNFLPNDIDGYKMIELENKLSWCKGFYDKNERFIEIESSMIDGYLIAMKELEQKKIPFIIQRPLPNGGCEYWRLNDLEIIS